jgi:hypothetical protein
MADNSITFKGVVYDVVSTPDPSMWLIQDGEGAVIKYIPTPGQAMYPGGPATSDPTASVMLLAANYICGQMPMEMAQKSLEDELAALTTKDELAQVSSLPADAANALLSILKARKLAGVKIP